MSNSLKQNPSTIEEFVKQNPKFEEEEKAFVFGSMEELMANLKLNGHDIRKETTNIQTSKPLDLPSKKGCDKCFTNTTQQKNGSWDTIEIICSEHS